MASLKRLIAAVLLVVIATPAAAQRMQGGGYVSGFSQACNPGSSVIQTYQNQPRVYYRPGEWNNGDPTQLILDYTDGSIHLTRNAAFAPRNNFLVATGRQIFPGAGFSDWAPRPTIRIDRRVVTFPPGAAIRNAQEVFLRLTIRNFWGVRGCTVTLVATVAGSLPPASASSVASAGALMSDSDANAGSGFLQD